MFFKQQMPPILMGLAFILFPIIILSLPTVFSDTFPLPYSFLLIAGGVYAIFHAFRWIQAVELIVHEKGFSFKVGRRECTAKYEDVFEMGYADVTLRGKVTGAIRLYVVFNNNEKNLYLPTITKEKEGDWSEISECLANIYMEYTDKELVTDRLIPY